MITVTFKLDQLLYPEETENIIRDIIEESFGIYPSFEYNSVKIIEKRNINLKDFSIQK